MLYFFSSYHDPAAVVRCRLDGWQDIAVKIRRKEDHGLSASLIYPESVIRAAELTNTAGGQCQPLVSNYISNLTVPS